MKIGIISDLTTVKPYSLGKRILTEIGPKSQTNTGNDSTECGHVIYYFPIVIILDFNVFALVDSINEVNVLDYLQFSAGGFRSRRIQLWQVVLSKTGCEGGYISVR